MRQGYPRVRDGGRSGLRSGRQAGVPRGVRLLLALALTGAAACAAPQSSEGPAAAGTDSAAAPRPVAPAEPPPPLEDCAGSTHVLLAAPPVDPVPVGPSVAPRPVTPRPAAHLVDSVGVAIHMTYNDTPYGDHDRVLAALADTGIRHVRDGHVPGAEARQREFLTRLAAQGGCAQMLLGGGGQTVTGPELARGVALLAGRAAALSAVEGPNELDLSGRADWPAVLRATQEEVATAVRARPTLADVPLVGPSVGRPRSFRLAGDLSANLDLGNLHPYPGGEPPELEALELHLTAAQAATAGRRVVVSETGYHDAVAEGTDQPGVPEDVEAAYLPRLLLDAFARGVVRTYLYELVDEFPDPDGDDEQASFGLFRRDWTPKPAARSTTALLTLLRADGATSGGRAAPPALEVAVRTPAPDSGVRSLLLADAGGSWLAVWSEAPLWDTRSRQRLASPAVPVEVVLGEARDVAVHRPTTGTARVAEHAGTASLRLDVPGDPLLLRIEGPPAG